MRSRHAFGAAFGEIPTSLRRRASWATAAGQAPSPLATRVASPTSSSIRPMHGSAVLPDPASQWLQDRQPDRPQPDERLKEVRDSFWAMIRSSSRPEAAAMPADGEIALDRIGDIKRATARQDGATGRPKWPMIVLRSPKEWTRIGKSLTA